VPKLEFGRIRPTTFREAVRRLRGEDVSGLQKWLVKMADDLTSLKPEEMPDMGRGRTIWSEQIELMSPYSFRIRTKNLLSVCCHSNDLSDEEEYFLGTLLFDGNPLDGDLYFSVNMVEPKMRITNKPSGLAYSLVSVSTTELGLYYSGWKYDSRLEHPCWIFMTDEEINKLKTIPAGDGAGWGIEEQLD
jgi:hypothetical protein